MLPSHFDAISKHFATHRLSRRRALATSTHATAQDATPDPTNAYEKRTYLFVQSFTGGSLAPKDGHPDRFTLTLDASSGQTVYFADRPSRDAGVSSTPDFLAGLGFAEDNPPNAALIVETPDGETDIAVLELFAPIYDPLTGGVTYDVQSLANWQEDLDLGLRETPADLDALPAEFPTAHLFIDDCAQATVYCVVRHTRNAFPLNFIDMCWNYSTCIPCEPYGHDQPSYCATYDYWKAKCDRDRPECTGDCFPDFGDWTAIHCSDRYD